jgi:hypothetical protein
MTGPQRAFEGQPQKKARGYARSEEKIMMRQERRFSINS